MDFVYIKNMIEGSVDSLKITQVYNMELSQRLQTLSVQSSCHPYVYNFSSVNTTTECIRL